MESEEPGGDSDLSSPTICFLGNYPPKECGIATFTRDLQAAMNRKFNPELEFKTIALNEDSNIYNYGEGVALEINKDDIDDYIEVAKRINKMDNVKLVCIQHEFGIFGGELGNHIIPFLELIEKPVATIFHSVLPKPDMARERIVKSLCDKSSAVIVMARKAIEILKNDYGIDEEKIFFVPHGIPNVLLVDSMAFKKKIHFEGRTILSTFGLLSRGKGIQYMIRALPKLVEKYPDLLYLIVGETHPVVRREEGESYRDELKEEIIKLGLKKHVKFCNSYLSLSEIIDYILASDVYVCTNLDKNQIVSGTLSYAMGCGRVVVSSPIEYAKEFLSQDRGIVVREKDPRSYVKAIDKVLSDCEFKKFIEGNAYSYSRSMIWSNVAIAYKKVFNNILKLQDREIERFPDINLGHVVNMTDDFGIIQFSRHSSPDVASGYTIDDNSRALIASTLHNKLFGDSESLRLSKIYLNFIERCQNEDGWFNNLVVNGKIVDDKSEDAFGRTLWALGYVVNKSGDGEVVERANVLFKKSLGILDRIESPRAIAFSIIGLYHYYKKNSSDEILELIRRLTDYLVKQYDEASSKDWRWFEEVLSYSNSKLSEALYLAYDVTKNDRYLEVARGSLNFLTELTFVDGKICLIGQNGWCKKNGKRSFFDQQPVDASSLVHTYLTAYSVTGDKEYRQNALMSLQWFLGKNHLNQMVYDETTGGCFDGVGKYSLNMNQGAESTLSYLIARLFLEEANRFGVIV